MTKKHDIMWFKSVDSTNYVAQRRISDIDNLSVLSAWEQTAGRGQRGNKWSSKSGENLMFSIVLKFSCDGTGASEVLPGLSAREQFVLNEIASLSVVDFLSRYGITAEIKWPNDVYVGSRKICGILIENSLRGAWLSSSIIGIGLNINQRNFDVNLPNPTSMVICLQNQKTHSYSSDVNPSAAEHHVCDNEHQGCHSDLRYCHPGRSEGAFALHPLLEEFMDIFTSYHDIYVSSGSDLSPLRQIYLDHLWRLDQPSRYIDYTRLPEGHLCGPMNIYTSDGAQSGAGILLATDQRGTSLNACREFPGIIRGMSEIGNLLVEDLTSGQIREFGFKEIGYIL